MCARMPDMSPLCMPDGDLVDLKSPPVVRMSRFFDHESDESSLSPVEREEMSKVTVMHRRLPVEGRCVDTRTAAGRQACEAFLHEIAALADVMQIEKTSRAYRATFTRNYTELFPTHDVRGYRVELLEASAAQSSVLWINGEDNYFSQGSLALARELQDAWLRLGSALEAWAWGAPPGASSPGRAELCNVLAAFDRAWAHFERAHVGELMAMEHRSREVLVGAVEHERLLRLLEAHHGGHSLHHLEQYREAHRRMAGLVARLSVAVRDRRQAPDGHLCASVLLDSMAVLSESRAARHQQAAVESAVARGVVDSFAAVRAQIRAAGSCVERVDPRLRNNASLVARLADWEEQWGIGRRYLQSRSLRSTLCELVVQLRRVQILAPGFAAMCGACDAELFMILPRVMWLCFLEEPDVYAAQMQHLLPEMFAEASQSPPGAAGRQPAEELRALADEFRLVRSSCEWEPLLRSAALGLGCDAAASHQSGRGSERGSGGQGELLEGFMRTLESWSMQLQRNKPDEWNRWCAIVIRCLNASPPDVSRSSS